MQKRLFQLSACLLFTWSFAIAQKNQQTEDSVFFENFFARYQTQVQANRPVDTDSIKKSVSNSVKPKPKKNCSSRNIT
ncbi:MAG: hypothetical protein KF825_04135 [Ferruginibacter sp.]|nr:hypothetical protein [Ferruginibacter sp.]